MNQSIRSSVIELTAPRTLHIRHEDISLSVSDDDIVAQTLFSAISPGTELAAYRGDPPLRPMKVYPRVVGYCNVARVLAAGSKVSRARVGDLILNFESHRSAFRIKEEEIVVTLPPGTDPILATTTYLFHLGHSALLRTRFTPGMNVAVVGMGVLGLTSCALASAFGGQVFAFSNQELSSEDARVWGIQHSYRKDDANALADLRTRTKGVGIDLVISTSNSWSDWELALSLARVEGTIAVLGFPGRSESIPPFNPLDSRYVYDKQLTIMAVGRIPNIDVLPEDYRFTMKRNCAFLLDLISENKLPARSLVTATVPWNTIQDAYGQLDQRARGVKTIVLDWGSV